MLCVQQCNEGYQDDVDGLNQQDLSHNNFDDAEEDHVFDDEQLVMEELAVEDPDYYDPYDGVEVVGV